MAARLANIAPVSITDAVATANCTSAFAGTPTIHATNTNDDTIAPDSPA